MIRLQAKIGAISLNAMVFSHSHCSLLQSRSFHAAAVRLKKIKKDRQTKGPTLTRPGIAVSLPQKDASPASTSRISEKIQVIPFNLMPEEALTVAQMITLRTVMQSRGRKDIGGVTWWLFQTLRMRLGISSKAMVPRKITWQAIYLPVWHIDHVVSLQQRVRGCVQQVEIASRDWRIPATHVEPFASIPLTVPDNSILVEDAETYNVQKHSNVFKQDDMPAGEPVIRPVVIPFSSMLPNLEDVYRKAASTYWDDNDISFLGEVKTRLQLEYPLLLPFYLVEVADLNPQYHGETTTCLLMGRQFGKGRFVARVYRDDRWIEGEPTPPGMVISVYPTPETFRYSSITQLAQISDDFVDLSKQASADLSITMFRSIKDNCTRLTPNIKLVDFSSKIESIESVRRYDEKASAEMKHALAKIAERALTFKLEIAKSLPQASLDNKAKILSITKGRFLPIWFKWTTGEEINKKRADLIAEAQSELENARKDVEATKPTKRGAEHDSTCDA